MSWDDDSDADDVDERRLIGASGPAPAWQTVRRALGYAGLSIGVIGLAIAAVIAVNVVGLAAKPAGFEAPLANGTRLALPPVVSPTEQAAEDDGELEPTQEPGDPAELADPTGSTGSPMPEVESDWMSQIAEATNIPLRALSAYALAHVSIAEEQPECGIDWATIAAIGRIESGHGSHAGTGLNEHGYPQPAIVGRALDGDGVATIRDTDGGLLDGDATWDRAVGPMQFIPSTWERWGADGNGDGSADPNQIDDAALAAARYLCASGPMTSAEGWRAAVYSYNHDNDYVDKVARAAAEYAAAVG
jgi:membrane-bound lytic murein transglycosylase B